MGLSPIDLFPLEEIRLWRAANPETFASRNGLYKLAFGASR